jgi:thiol:disulfide interchange protein DsbD
MAGLKMVSAEHWHTYWRNPGEAGKSTEIEWTLPAGVTAGPIQWPVPETYDWSGLINYVYHGETILLIPLSIDAGVSSGLLEIKGEVDWLECKEQCVPGHAAVGATLNVGETFKTSAEFEMLEAAKTRLPQPYAGTDAEIRWAGEGDDSKRQLLVTWTPSGETLAYDFLPYESDSYLIEPAVTKLEAGLGKVMIRKNFEKFEGTWPERLEGLLVERNEDGKAQAAFHVNLEVKEAGAVPEAVQSPLRGASPGGGGISLWGMLGLAFLGGLILNIMPCVLPVISLKILGFVNQSHESPGRVRFLGLIYGVGVMASFMVLAGLVVGVQKAGNVASWGMQFGNPVFLVAITLLVMLVALNLFGVFEVNLGGSVTGAAGTLAAREGAGGAFFNGVLATALATPCTAPFLSVALGFAFTQPAPVIVLTFATVALGLAAPYMILAMQPRWLKFLPKPGAWMERFKVVMGFPMLATAIWLFSIITRHYGGDGILWVGLFMVLVALALWIWGEFVQRGRRFKPLAMTISLLLIGGGYLFALESQLQWRSPESLIKDGQVVSVKSDGIPWQTWSLEAVDQARAQGHPVLVDFTADWCLTCKANKKTSLEIDSVRDKLKQIDAVPLLADNTLVRDDIAKELRKYDRAGVPLVLVYPRDPDSAPLVLPTVLTPGIVLEALDQVAP